MTNLRPRVDFMPKVTVILAAYNCSHILRCALTSLCNQTYKDFEAWVIGDCCTDDSEQIVAGFCDPRLKWTNLPERVGSQSGPNNEGLRLARGEYIAYLGQDDLWFPWHLQSLVTTLEETNADFVHAVVALLSETRPAEGKGAPNGMRSYGSRFIPPSGFMHRRSIIESAGFWPAPGNIVEGVDAMFQRQAFLAGYRFAGTGRVSIIKFPSPFWNIYARSNDFPQQEYLTRMEQSPEDLHVSVLMQLVNSSVQRSEDLDIRLAFRTLLRAIYRCGIDLYGMDRWPVSSFLRWKHKGWRRRMAKLRGLTTLPAPSILASGASLATANPEASQSSPVRN